MRRTMRVGGMALCSVALMVGLVNNDASGYCLYQPTGITAPIYWPMEKAITYNISDTLPQDPSLREAIRKAFQAWGGVECSKLKFTEGDPFSICDSESSCGSAIPFKHKQTCNCIYVFWSIKHWDGFNNPQEPSKPFAALAYIFRGTTGQIRGASIAINASDYGWNARGGDVDMFDLQSELTTQIGLIIGLTYSDAPGSVMVEKMVYGNAAKRVLSADDKNGLLYLYSTKASGCPNPPQPGANGCSGSGAPLGDGGAGLADGGQLRTEAGLLMEAGGGGSSAGGGTGEPSGSGGCGCELGAVPQTQVQTWELTVIAAAGMVFLFRRRRRKSSLNKRLL